MEYPEEGPLVVPSDTRFKADREKRARSSTRTVSPVPTPGATNIP
jgi:hypothetical protein